MKPQCETSVLFSSMAVGIVEVHSHSNVPQRPACIVARDTLVLYNERPFYVNLASFSDQEAWLYKHQRFSIVI